MRAVETEQKIKVIVVDDEPISCEILRRHVQKDAEINLVAVCSDGQSAVNEIKRFQPDLIFLDVEMPGMDGFEVLTELKETPLVVFVTAYDKYAVRAFEMNAVDYLLKPFDPSRFAETLKRSKQKLRLQRYEQPDGTSLSAKYTQQRQITNKNSIPYVRTMMIQTGATLHVVHMKDVQWIAASNQYVYFHLADRSYLKRDSLNRLERCLDPAQFVRVHRSAMVNMNFIKYVKFDLKGSMHLVLTSESKIHVSRLKKKHVRLALQVSGSD